jgi:hypothetical protein
MAMGGACTWFVPDAYLPARGQGSLVGHEAICILNTSEERAHVEIDFYFEDREPQLGIGLTVGPQRSLHVRTDQPAMLAGFEVPREVPYAMRIRSTIPIVVQYSRMDVTQPNLALMTCMAFPGI